MTMTLPEGSIPTQVVEKKYLYPFVLVTTLFALWGFANDVTNPLVRAFREIFLISNAQSSWVQMAFYGGYATMALPAALVIRKFSYKTGIIVGLSLYAIGALLTVPAAQRLEFNLFLVGFYVLTFGLAFLETSANPYILSLGSPETATRRLNLAQAFNPVGSLSGMLAASLFILPNLEVSRFRTQEKAAHPEYSEALPGVVDAKITQALETFSASSPAAHEEMVRHDLGVVTVPYVVMACVVIATLLLFVVSKLPDSGHETETVNLARLLKRLASSPRYLGGVLAQTFYVGAQIMCWTFIIHYGMTLHGLDAATAQNFNIVAMVLFLSSRFVAAALLKHIGAGTLLFLFATGGTALCLAAVFIQGIAGLYALVGVSIFMSMMFPTIYGIALRGMTPDDAKLGSAGLIFAIVGGALMPRLQGGLIDGGALSFAGVQLESVRVSFLLPVVCFMVIGAYGLLARRLDAVEMTHRS